MDESLIQPQDRRFYVDDANFNPNKNKAVIAETIAETTKFFTELEEAKDKELENRVDILSSYARYRFNKGDKNFEGYAGRELYKALIGEKILSKVRVMEATNRINGNDKFKKSILL